MDPFFIGYMVNPKLNFNRDSIVQVEKCLKETFYSTNMSVMENVLKK